MLRFLAMCSAFIAVLLLVAPTGGFCAAGQQCPSPAKVYRYDQPGSRVSGKLLQRTVFGPPGYGESPSTDPKVKIIILKLNCPIDLHPDPGATGPQTSNLSSFPAIREIQLFFSDKKQKSFVRRHLGEKVMVAGRLEEGVAGGEYTKVIMDVEQISSNGQPERPSE